MLLNSKIVKSGVAALVVVGLSASVASGAFAERGDGGKHGGKRGGMISKICAPDAAEKAAERSAKLQGVLNLTAEQQVLFDAMQGHRASVIEAAKPFCGQITEGERPSKELRKEIKSTMKAAKEAGEDTRDEFHDSLTSEQKKEMRKEKRGKHGKRGMKNNDQDS